MGELRFGILGPLEAWAGDRRLRLTAGKQRAVLAMLLLELNRVVHADALADALWHGTPPSSVRVTLRSLVSRLRKELESAGDDTVVLVAEPPGYVLRADPDRVDLRRFEALVAAGRGAARAGDAAAAAAALDRAVALWRGPALTDLAEFPFAGAAALHIDETRLTAIEDLAEARLALGAYDDVVTAMEAHVAAHPFRERAWGRLMVALYRTGRQAEALAAFRRLRHTLGSELGIEPSEAIRRLEGQILRQEEIGGPPNSAGEGGGDTRRGPMPDQDGGRHNLPAILTRFVGREHERRRLGELLADAPLVTLTGPGGVGKTRLSLEVARELRPAFPDGVFLVDLAPIQDPGLIPHQFVAALGLAVGGEQATPGGLVERLAAHLSRRRVLLLVDNCEHLLAGVRALVDDLLRRCPPLAVLATSRERLSVTGETVWRVPSLSVPATGATEVGDVRDSDAVALFLDRARAAQPDFTLEAGNAADVARVCRSLDGIPLAIELATARLGVLTPGEIAARLDERLALLTRGSATAPSRHQTLRACMDWGYDLLAEPERALLRQLCVFADRFDLAAAEAVGAGCANGMDVLDVLSRLVDTSWVTAAAGRDGTRFRLMETVRQFAAERLVLAGEDAEARRRHRDHFLVVAGGFLGFPSAAPGSWLAKVAADYENLRAALEWSWRTGDAEQALWLSSRLFAHWVMDGRYAEGRDWLGRTLEAEPRTASSARAWALVATGMLTWLMPGAEDGADALEAARALADALGDRLIGAHAEGYLAAYDMLRGDSVRAAQRFAGAKLTCVELGFTAGSAWCDYHLGWAEFYADPAAAAAAFDRAIRVGAAEGRDVLMAQASAARAALAALGGDVERAVALGHDALAAARRLGLRLVVLMALTRLAEVSALADDGVRSAGCTREGLRLLREVGGGAYVGELLQLAGLAQAEGGDRHLAVRLIVSGQTAAGTGSPDRPLPLHAVVAACRDRLAADLGPDAFAAESRIGALLSTENAVDDALAALDPGWAPWASAQRERRTFMFTDIVGSTELAERLGDEAWTAVLRRHDEAVRTVLAAHGGEEVKHTGDGFFVAFDAASAATRCAVAIQDRLSAGAEGGPPEVRVRIGLHETDAVRRGHDYHGAGVHTAARIAALAGPGQILASRATCAPSARYVLGDPRSVALKGVAEPVEIVDVAARSVPA